MLLCIHLDEEEDIDVAAEKVEDIDSDLKVSFGIFFQSFSNFLVTSLESFWYLSEY